MTGTNNIYFPWSVSRQSTNQRHHSSNEYTYHPQLGFSYCSLIKGMQAHGEMTDYRTRQEIGDKSDSFQRQKKEVLNKTKPNKIYKQTTMTWYIKKTQELTERAPNGQS